MRRRLEKNIKQAKHKAAQKREEMKSNPNNFGKAQTQLQNTTLSLTLLSVHSVFMLIRYLGHSHKSILSVYSREIYNLIWNEGQAKAMKLGRSIVVEDTRLDRLSDVMSVE
jgi:hypothetical protein